MRRFWRLFISTILVPIVLTGCWDQKIYETIGFALQVGIESSDDKRLLITYTLPVTDPKKSEQVELISGKAGLLREFRENSRKISAKLPETGKVQQVVISSSLAEKGTQNLLEIFEREQSNPASAYVVISEGSPRMIFDLTQKLGDKPRPGFYLHQLIENNIKYSQCPDTTIFEFLVNVFAPGIDPIAPIVKFETEEAKGVKVDGAALFSGDKMVGKINTKETALILAMNGKMRKNEFIFSSIGPPENDVTGKTGAAVLLSKPKRKIDIKIENNIPVVKIALKFRGDYDEHQWDHIDKRENQKRYEKLMSEELKSECMKVLDYTQQVGSDPLGIGDMVKAKHYSFWKDNKWGDMYKNVEFQLDITVDIVRYGISK